jgi:hypothetical protein
LTLALGFFRESLSLGAATVFFDHVEGQVTCHCLNLGIGGAGLRQ